MTYVWKNGSRFHASAQAAGEVIQSLDSSGKLSAQSLVDVSKPEDAPLHEDFDWDDPHAANEYRKEQARRIIRCYHAVVEGSEQGKEQVTAQVYYHIEQKPDVQEYKHIETILASEDDTAALLRQMKRDARIFYQRYERIRSRAGEDVQVLFAAFDRVLSDDAA